PLFRPFSPTQRRELLRRFTAHDVAPGAAIIRQGDRGRGLFVVLAGEVEVSAVGDGAATALSILRPGDVFCEMSIVRGGPTTASVTALTPGSVLFLAGAVVERMVARVPEIRAYLEALAAARALDTRLAVGAPPAEGLADGDVEILL